MEISEEELRNKILRFRAINNINQKEMAKILNIGSITLSNFERGTSVKLTTKIKMYEKLKELEG